MASTPHLVLKAAAGQLEMAIDHLLDEIEFGQTMRTVVIDALFGLGVVKTGLREAGTWQEEGISLNVGQPFADPIDLDDLIIDMNQKRWDKLGYIGHRFSMPLDQAREFEGFDKDQREQIQSRDKPETTEGEDRIEEIGRSDGNIEELEERAEFFELWIPGDNLIVVCNAKDVLHGSEYGKPLSVREWTGPEMGPYDRLSFLNVPGNLLPKPPVAGLLDMHLACNNALRKLHEQARNEKQIFTFEGIAAEDAERITNANHGETVRNDHPGNMQEMLFNGISNSLMAFFLQTRDQFSWAAGNLEAQAGLASQSETFGQDRLLAQSSSKLVAAMQDDTVDFVSRVVNKLGWYLWYDPLISIPMVKRIEGVDVEMPFTFDYESKEGDFLDYNIRIQPYSMSHQSPNDKLQALQTIVTQFIAPFQEQMAAQGIALNMPGMMRHAAKLLDMDELDELLIFTGEHEQLSSPVQAGGSRKPASTTRQYERVVNGGGAKQGSSQMIQQLLASGGPPQKQPA